MSKVKTKFKVKDLYARNAKGEMENYGPLVAGSIHGIPCLGYREVLLLLGIKLIGGKQPQVFHTYSKLHIQVAGKWFIVYAKDQNQLDSLAVQLSYRGYQVKAVVSHDPGIVLNVWEYGISVQETPRRDPVESPRETTYRPWKRKSKLKKVWLVIKRLFSKDE